jgi:hypothetical protein
MGYEPSPAARLPTGCSGVAVVSARGYFRVRQIRLWGVSPPLRSLPLLPCLSPGTPGAATDGRELSSPGCKTWLLVNVTGVGQRVHAL